jgi:hypothetical protein
MFTVELLPDARLAAQVRALWELLRDAGLPSLATHPHPTNRPHLTVLTCRSVAGLPPLPLPVDAELGRVRVLGRALVREVTQTAALRDIYAVTWEALGGADAWPTPPEWVPHVSLALKVPAPAREVALRMLAGAPPLLGRFVAARSYDTVARTVTGL